MVAFEVVVTIAPGSTNSSFDPWNQEFTLTQPDGLSRFNSSVADINSVQQNAVYQSITQATQVGAGLILLLALMLITKPDKRRSFVFLFNALALLFVVLRGVLSLIVFTGPFYDFIRWELLYYDNLGHAKAVSAAAEVMTWFLTLTIELSLVLQVRIVCCNLSSIKRKVINIFNGLVAFTSVAIRFALMVMNIDWNIVHVETEMIWDFNKLSAFASATNITLVVSIGISAVIFCAKLAFAIQSRRSMGMKQFGPMQIIFVMGCQTMFTPLIFTIVAYWGVNNAQIGSFVPTIVALSLPLSAMWAAVNTNNVHVAKSGDRAHRAVPLGASEFASGKAFGFGKGPFDTINTNSTLVDDDSAALTGNKTSARSNKSDTDVEMQKMGAGVQVDRTYSVRTD